MKRDKLDFFKIIWIFTIGSILGYIGECAFYVLKYHYFVNKQGLIMGPFKPMYGIALIIATYLFRWLKADKKWQQFLYGLFIGIIFEYLTSFLLEKIWDIYMWDYSTYKYNINGRVYLPYAVIWGSIGMVYYSYLLPFILKTYDKLYGKILKIVSIILTIFLIIDIIFTVVIFYRIRDYSKTNVIYNVVDYVFPKEVIDKRFSKVKLKK